MLRECISVLNFQNLWFLATGTLILLAVIIIVPLLIIKLPSDYFASEKYNGIISQLKFPMNVLLLSFKNGVGFIFVCIGIILLFMPGQGLLTLFTGLMLMNFPGKRSIELYIVRKKSILNAINWTRKKAGKDIISDVYKPDS
jgi:Putative transmembrane protein (PGPGW)